MKRPNVLLLALAVLVSIAVSGGIARQNAQATGNVYIVDNDDDLFDPNNNINRTTAAPVTAAPTAPPATAAPTTSATEDALGRVYSAIDSALDRLMSGLGGETTTAAPLPTTPIPSVTAAPATAGMAPTANTGNLRSDFTMPATTAPPAAEAPATAAAPTAYAGAPAAEPQNGGVIRYTVEGAAPEREDSALSGSTLTLIVFIAAVLILILVIILVLVILTRRTEFNSSVMNRSTLPNVEKPDNSFIEDGAGGDTDLSDIRGWDS